MKRFYQIMLGLSLCLGVAALSGAATVNKWVDKDGNVHYSQQPPSDVNYEKINIKTSPSNAGSEPTPSTSSSSSGSSNSSGSAVVQQETAKAEAIRQQKCNAAKKNLEAYTVYRRIRDKNGNVRILSDTERAKGVTDSKAAIKEFCQ